MTSWLSEPPTLAQLPVLKGPPGTCCSGVKQAQYGFLFVAFIRQFLLNFNPVLYDLSHFCCISKHNNRIFHNISWFEHAAPMQLQCPAAIFGAGQTYNAAIGVARSANFQKQ